ncbi:MAG: DNA repair protein RecN [Prevotellaceae bacterium]|nr:DNA repair protein RecN [Prevotellaceae bacterium]MDY6130644.1 DNA repair protein RecN [Prevotella sp.]
MLKQLYIKNFTLIDALNIQFGSGFSVITGETGAGKSIILGAIALLTGQRADSRSIKSGAEKCIIEAHFDLSKYQMQDFFQENGVDYDANDCIVRRELTAAGKSRAFINDTPVQLAQMRSLGQQLVDIHSQHKNLLLQEEDFQLNVVDTIAENHELLEKYRNGFKAYKEAEKVVSQLQEAIEKAKENEDFLRFQLKELTDAALEPEMDVALEQERETLSHVEDIKSGLFIADNILTGEQAGVIERLKEASRALDNITDVYPEIKEVAERTESCYIELKDLSREIGSSVENIDFDPQRFEHINHTLDLIYALEKKHHADSVDELIRIREEIASQLDHINNSDEELKELNEKRDEQMKVCENLARKLTVQRQKAAARIEKEMMQRLAQLGIPHARFGISMEKKALSINGTDKIGFLFSANTNTPMQPASEVASGGEIARVMLSLKAMISTAVKLPTIIFDEIDTGVSGKIAECMAMIMQEMGNAERQVISITHLPQIAAKGARHYKVFKEETPQGATSRMQILDGEERVREIAQMLSGSDITPAAVSNARELLKRQ